MSFRVVPAPSSGEPASFVGLELTSLAQHLVSAASILNVAHAWMAAWWSPWAPSSSGTKGIVGTNNFGTPGVSVIGEGTDGTNRCKHIGFADNKYTSAVARDYHVPCDAEIGTGLLYRDDIYCDGVRIWLIRLGRAVSIGFASSITSFITTNPLAVNRRAATGAASLGYGAMTICGIQFSTTVPTRAQIAASFRDSPNTPIPGAIAHWAPADLGALGSSPGTWTDRIGARVLTVTGGPVVVAMPHVASRWCSVVGVTAMATTTQDFASRHTAVSGQCLGVNNGQAFRLTTLSADLDVDGATDTATVLAYGINDITWRCSVPGGSETAQQASDNLMADVVSAIAIIRAKRAMAPIYVQDVLRVATGVSSATVRSSIDIFNAALAAASLGTSVYVVAACAAVTPNQAAADDTAVLYDGTHESAASKALHGAAFAAAVVASGWTHLVFEIYGDSIAAGRIVAGTTDGGWRRSAVNILNVV